MRPNLFQVTRAGFDAQRGPQGALLIGSPEEVTEKILRHSEALGGISRLTFQMNAASLPHAKLMRAIEAIGTRIAPALKENWSRSLDNTCASVVCRVTETIV